MSRTLDLRSDFRVLSGLASLKLRVLEHLRLSRGEWVYEPTAGTPYDDLIFGVRDPDLISRIIIDEVRSVDEVDDAEATAIDLDESTRRLEVSILVQSRYGEFAITQEVA